MSIRAARYGFVAGPGVFETTLTRPDLFGHYYREQLRLLAKNHHVEIEVGVSQQPIPIHFAFAEGIHLEGDLGRDRLLAMRDVFDTPDLARWTIASSTARMNRARRAASARAVHGRARRFFAASAEALHGDIARRISRTTCSTRTTSSTSTSSSKLGHQ